MTDPDLVLYHCPGACSQVTVCALEMTKLPYRIELVNVFSGEHLKGDFAALTKLSKVPYLIIDGVGLRENVAILTYLADLRPDGGIFPAPTTIRARAEALSGLSFCSSTLHPILRGMLNPKRLTTGDTEGVRDMARSLGEKSFGYANERLKKQDWWLDQPSIVDIYLNWAWSGVVRAGLDPTPFPRLIRLQERLRELPSFKATLEMEPAFRAKLGL